ncbi:cell wall hydrolase [Paenibacillus sp. YPG26]|uniref:cell wall hydrolase n=1 Tax=Paenibacillus sp. YPG26 TaxID=2878915 RepID=UPI00203FBA83|nr:cell wall hydrolase [Paenibacillus sp. YPG26]USB34016.1 cell wall hydrolase [Paenibacillus sp. YPG26]
MDLFKQNRYVALLIGAILVCVGSICLLWRTAGIEDQGIMSMPRLGAESTVSMLQAQSLRPYVASNSVIQRTSPSHVATEGHALNKALEKRKIVKEQPITAAKIDKTIPPKQIFFTRTALLSPEDKSKSTWKYALSEEELLLLQKIVMAEAEGEPYEGKVAVANVVLNRLRSANYPDTIREVVYQKFQFSPVRNGRLKRVTPNKDTVRAVTEALHGRKEVSDDTYYFLSIKLASDLTVARTQKKIKQIGNHTFYK